MSIFLISCQRDRILKFSGKKYGLSSLSFDWNDTNPDRPAPDRNALDAEHDPDPAKFCGSSRIRIHDTAFSYKQED
jgi:hypothetical protein